MDMNKKIAILGLAAVMSSFAVSANERKMQILHLFSLM